MLAAYKNIFGAPRTGFHSVRLFDVAILDVAGTVAGGYLLARATDQPVRPTIIALFGLGIFAHWLFGVETFSPFPQ